MAMYRGTQPKQDEGSTATVKSLYVCECRGCGYFFDNMKPRRFCENHLTAESRKEAEAEYETLHSS
jgi:hypothetical protein